MSDTAVTIICATILQGVGAIIAYLSLKDKIKYGAEKAKEAADAAHKTEKKVDNNTAITEASTIAAAITAADVKTALSATEEVAKKLNGGVDSAITSAIKPLCDRLDSHAKKIEHILLLLENKK